MKAELSDSSSILKKSEQYFRDSQLLNYKRTDKFFALLMPAQWLGGIVAALFISPRSWNGAESSIHPHVWAALLLGAIISFLPTLLAIMRPGTALTRQTIAVGQMLTSSLLIHISGGRIETHFHIFGSLALLAFYRDRMIFPTATLVTTLDHFIRGYYFPLSIFGVAYVSPMRAVEHAAWVVFEVVFLLWSCKTSNKDGREVAWHKAMEMQQRQTQKLESIGQLAAGIAHEINTPIQFVGDNVRFLQQEFVGISSLLQTCSATEAANQSAVANIIQVAQAIDSEYLASEIPKALEQSLEGIQRISRIVSAMKEFSHPGGDQKQAIDINKAVESTMIISTNEWKYVADSEMNLDRTLPLVPCIVGEFNQVLLNLFVNAAHEIADVKDKFAGGKGKILVSTKNLGEKVEIRIQDTGGGIPNEIAHKIFDPFFTTKEVGKGTGQGLTLAHHIIINKHGGEINFESKVGVGTTFILTLPTKESVSPSFLDQLQQTSF